MLALHVPAAKARGAWELHNHGIPAVLASSLMFFSPNPSFSIGNSALVC